MSLSADPQFYADPNGEGGLYGGSTGTTLAAGASTTKTFAVGVGSGSTSGYATACLSARLQALDFGQSTVAGTNGLQVQIFSSSDGGTQYDTTAFAVNQTITTVASTVEAVSWEIPPGYYQCKLTNLDATNAIKVGLSLGWTA